MSQYGYLIWSSADFDFPGLLILRNQGVPGRARRAISQNEEI